MVYKTKDGIEVYEIDGVSHSHRGDLNKEALEMVEIGGRGFVRDVVPFGRTIGVDHLVETKDGDEIATMSRNGNEYETRFVMNKEAEPTDKATVIIAKGGPEDGDLEGKYILITLFEGDPGMPEPYGRNEGNPECISFWENHALVPTPEQREMIEIEQRLAYETRNTRAFITPDGEPTSFYSPSQNRDVKAVVELNRDSGRITIEFGRDAASDKQIGEIAESLWGKDAHVEGRTITSPEGADLSDLVSAVMKVEESIEPPHDLARMQELGEIREELPEAVKERAQELDIPLDSPADAPGGGHDR